MPSKIPDDEANADAITTEEGKDASREIDINDYDVKPGTGDEVNPEKETQENEDEDVDDDGEGDEGSVDLEGEDGDDGDKDLEEEDGKNAIASDDGENDDADNTVNNDYHSALPSQGQKRKNVGEEHELQPQCKRPRKCPTKDSILIDVPLHVTADLGVAMRRTRRKRVRRIQRWVKSITDPNSGVVKMKLPKNDNDGGIESRDDNGEAGNPSQDLDDEDEDSEEGLPNRDQYGSVLDYLEAKYVRGVMIADYDEREQAKKKKSKKKKEQKEVDGKEEDDNSKEGDESDDDGKGSCYDDADGDFLDDSLLQEEVADQVLASSSYGKTKIEEEASKRKKRKLEKISDGGEREPKAEGEESDEADKSDDDSEDDVNSDFDDGFFVNVGDLEMAEGWKGDEDIVIAPSKKKHVKKRAHMGDGKKLGRPKGSKTKNKNGKEEATPGQPKKKKLKQTKDKKSAASTSSTKKKKSQEKAKDKSEVKAKNKTEGKAKVTDKSKPEKKKNKNKPGPKPKADKGSNAKEKTTGMVSPVKTKKSNKSSTPKEPKSSSPKSEPKPNTPKEKAARLRKLVTRRYNACVKMIKELTSEELPTKKKSNGMVKVSVNIPPDKSIGDEITFANPNVPGQRLKVCIPKKANMKKRCFVVSIPAPKVTTEEKKENNLPKELKENLFHYSNAYDDWCTAEGEYQDSLPADKQKEKFKITTQRLKKFDEMVKEFPQEILTPIDLSYLRLIVRRVRNNKAKIQARKDGPQGETKKQKPMNEEDRTSSTSLEIQVPQKGTEFVTISFDISDFRESK